MIEKESTLYLEECSPTLKTEHFFAGTVLAMILIYFRVLKYDELKQAMLQEVKHMTS